jgi:hypothetical protein
MTVASQDVHAFWLATETNGHACRGTQCRQQRLARRFIRPDDPPLRP